MRAKPLGAVDRGGQILEQGGETGEEEVEEEVELATLSVEELSVEVGVSHQLHRDRLTVLTEDFSLVMEEWGEVLVQVGGRDATRNLSPKKCGQTLPKRI